MQKKCIYCGNEFTAKTNAKRYCSKTCKQYFYHYRCQLRSMQDRPYHVREYTKVFLPIFVKKHMTKEVYRNYGQERDPRNFMLTE
jgi:hypothetical protein